METQNCVCQNSTNSLNNIFLFMSVSSYTLHLWWRQFDVSACSCSGTGQTRPCWPLLCSKTRVMRLQGWSVTVCDDVFSLAPQSCGGIREVRSGRLVRGWRGSRDLRILVCVAVESSGVACLPAAGTETILKGIPVLARAMIKRCNDLSHVQY